MHYSKNKNPLGFYFKKTCECVLLMYYRIEMIHIILWYIMIETTYFILCITNNVGIVSVSLSSNIIISVNFAKKDINVK